MRALALLAIAGCAIDAPAGDVDVIAWTVEPIASVRVAAAGDELVLVLDDQHHFRGVLHDVVAGTPLVLTAVGADADGAPRATTVSPELVLDPGALVALQLASSTPIAAAKNRAPVIDTLVASAQSVVAGGTLSLSASAHDPDGDPFAFAWTGPGTFAAPSAASTSWTAPPSTGNAKLTITATDARGAAASTSIAIAVMASTGGAKVTATLQSPPTIANLVAAGPLRRGVATSVTATASDPDRDPLTYTWGSSCAAVFGGRGPTVTATVPAGSAATACTIELVVDDGHGQRAHGQLVAPVRPN